MKELRLIASDVEVLRSLLASPDERCAVLLTRIVQHGHHLKALVSEIIRPDLADYTRASPVEAELRPDFVARVTKRARAESNGLVFVHSHCGSQPPTFSHTDGVGEEQLAAFLQRRHSQLPHAALVISAGGMRARQLGGDEGIRVISVGRDRDTLFEPTRDRAPSEDIHDRQIRVFGERAQATLRSLHVAIVGLGGTGSIVAQQLAHLGVRTFTLIDADTIEASNLNRVANANQSDIGCPKVEVAARYIKRIAVDCEITEIVGDVMKSAVAHDLVDVDVIFACTDSHGSRAVIQQVAYQFLIPCIDVGVIVAIESARIAYVFGRVQFLAPGLACLTCSGLLNSAEVRRDMMTAFERQADPYITGAREAAPAPAVMSLNGTVSSLAVTMLLATFVGFPANGRHWLYDALSPRLRSVEAEPVENCYICSRTGALARGESWPLFARNT
jgi:molybdopterin/thiamine biosynthesis adenylyltransferase